MTPVLVGSTCGFEYAEHITCGALLFVLLKAFVADRRVGGNSFRSFKHLLAHNMFSGTCSVDVPLKASKHSTEVVLTTVKLVDPTALVIKLLATRPSLIMGDNPSLSYIVEVWTRIARPNTA